MLREKPDLRVFATRADQGTRGPNGSSPMPGELDYKRLLGGFLVQTRDALPEQSFTPKVVTQRHPVLAELTSLLFAWRAVKHVTSNGVVLAKGLSLVGFGTGQPSRQDAVDLACRKAGDRARGVGAGLGRVLPVPGCGRTRGRRRGDGDHSARRLEPRPGADPRREPPRHGDDLHR